MKKIIKRWNLKDLFPFFTCFLIVSCLSVVYSALNSNLMITGEAYVRVESDIRITSLVFVSSNNEGYETYSSKYSKDTTSLFVTLPNSDSTVTYDVTVTNQTSDDYLLTDIIEENYTNLNIGYKIENIEIFDMVEGNSNVTFRITLYNKDGISNQEGTLVLKYKFELDVVDPPEVSGQSTEWATSRTFELTPPVSTNGIASYEYYISDSTTTPDSTVTPTGSSTSTSITIKETGKYIYFRAINNAGTIGKWTIYQNLFVDTCSPSVSISGNNTSNSNWTQDNVVLTVSEDYNVCICGIKSYQWYSNGSSISDATSNTYEADEHKNYSVEVTYNNGVSVSDETEVYIDTTTPYVNSVTTSSTYNSIQLVVDAFDAESGVSSYMVEYKVNGSSAAFKSTSWQSSNTINVKSLNPGVTYAFRVKVKDKVGRVATKSTYYEETKSFYMPQVYADPSWGTIILEYDSSYIYEPDAIYSFELSTVDGGSRIRASDYVASGSGDTWEDTGDFEFYNEDFYNEMVLTLGSGETGYETLIEELQTGDSLTMYACTENYSVCQTKIINVVVDETPPTTTAPTITAVGTKITIVNNQTDENGLSSQTVWYKVNSCTDTSCWKSKSISSITGTTTLSSKIEAGTTYNFYTRSCDNAGNCSNSATVNFTTEAADTTSPTTTVPVVNVVDSRSIKVTNQQTDSESSIDATKYRVDYKLPSETVWSSLASANSREATLTSLTPNTTYDIRTYACDEKGNCSTSEIVQATTKNYIWGCEYSSVTYAGYTITCNIDRTVTKVNYPTWTVANGQDDLGTWPTATINSTTRKASYYVKTSDHNYENGNYVTHAYATSSELSSSIAIILSTVTVPDSGPYTKYKWRDVYVYLDTYSYLVLESSNTINPYIKVATTGTSKVNPSSTSFNSNNDYLTVDEFLEIMDRASDYKNANINTGGVLPYYSSFSFSPPSAYCSYAYAMVSKAAVDYGLDSYYYLADYNSNNGLAMTVTYEPNSSGCDITLKWDDGSYYPIIKTSIKK